VWLVTLASRQVDVPSPTHSQAVDRRWHSLTFVFSVEYRFSDRPPQHLLHPPVSRVHIPGGCASVPGLAQPQTGVAHGPCQVRPHAETLRIFCVLRLCVCAPLL